MVRGEDSGIPKGRSCLDRAPAEKVCLEGQVGREPARPAGLGRLCWSALLLAPPEPRGKPLAGAGLSSKDVLQVKGAPGLRAVGCGPRLPQWGFASLLEPTAGLRGLQSVGVPVSLVPVFCSVFRKPPAQAHTSLQCNSPSSPAL